MTEAHVSSAAYAFLARFLHERCAFVLEPGKDYLILSRLSPLVRNYELPSVEALIARVRDGVDAAIADAVVEAMVTTETSFFRDGNPFDALRRSILPEIVERRRSQKSLNIWSAACSSGQEPYSIALLLKEHFPELRDWRIRLFATDLCREMIRRGQAGRYTRTEISRGLSESLRTKWFRQDGNLWALDDRVREMVAFSQLNLARPWPAMPRWDLVLMRNVLIYFDVATKREVLQQVARSLADGGYLVLGSAETTLQLNESFVRVESARSGIFRLRP